MRLVLASRFLKAIRKEPLKLLIVCALSQFLARLDQLIFCF
jgi:hypothetical protein